jgi:mevalonate pyrophosphate decarboxylase
VPVYYGRSVSTVGTPSDMNYMSVHMRLVSGSGATSTVNPSFVTQQNPPGSVLKSNVWAATPGHTAARVLACARFYPDNATALTSAAGCTTEFTLP